MAKKKSKYWAWVSAHGGFPKTAAEKKAAGPAPKSKKKKSAKKTGAKPKTRTVKKRSSAKPKSITTEKKVKTMAKKRGKKKGAKKNGPGIGFKLKAVLSFIPALSYSVGYAIDRGGTVQDKVIRFGSYFAACYTGYNAEFRMWDLPVAGIGWGPPLIIGGISKAEKVLKMPNANPFNLLSKAFA